MIVLSNTSAQTLASGQAITFDKVLFKSNGCKCCGGIRNSQVKIGCKGNYEITFHGNIGATAATTAAELTVELGGATLPETRMIVVSAAANNLFNVSSDTLVHNCCGCSSVRVINSGTATLTLAANSALVIKEV